MWYDVCGDRIPTRIKHKISSRESLCVEELHVFAPLSPVICRAPGLRLSFAPLTLELVGHPFARRTIGNRFLKIGADPISGI
jgi:hypothetical protein